MYFKVINVLEPSMHKLFIVTLQCRRIIKFQRTKFCSFLFYFTLGLAQLSFMLFSTEPKWQRKVCQCQDTVLHFLPTLIYCFVNSSLPSSLQLLVIEPTTTTFIVRSCKTAPRPHMYTMCGNISSNLTHAHNHYTKNTFYI